MRGVKASRFINVKKNVQGKVFHNVKNLHLNMFYVKMQKILS